MTNVKNYTTEQLLDHVKAMPDFKGIPQKYWLLCVRSNEDATDKFDDKRHLFHAEKFISVSSITTNKGNKGTAVMCTGWHYDSWLPSNGVTVRHHKGKTPCLRQVKGVPYRRDYTADGKTNPTTEIFRDIIFMNYHPATHDLKSGIVKENIGGWSEGCLVENNTPKYVILYNQIKNNGHTTVCLIDEF